MFKSEVAAVNDSIKKTKKAIIALGCSFVQGQGAVDDNLYVDYNWTFTELGIPLKLKLDPQEEKELLKKYPRIVKKNNELDFRLMELDNSFVHVLCNKYFEGKYTPINLGISGCGNRASIKELYFNPDINWHELEEVIVVYAPSGPERFDFVNDQWGDHAHWVAMWPHFKDKEPGPRRTLWQGYNEALYSPKFEVIEQISNVQELMLWCKSKNAKLVITPAFDRRYSKKYFKESLETTVHRTMDGTSTIEKTSLMDKVFGKEPSDEINNLMDMWPWDKMFKPDGWKTFADFVMAQEYPGDRIKAENDFYWNYLGKGSPNRWFTSCAHPSALGHDAFAHQLYNYIIAGK